MSPADGYWLDVPTGRNLLHMESTYRERSTGSGNTGHSLRSSGLILTRQTSGLTGIESSIEAERKSWKNEIRKAKLPGLGVFAGAGYSASGNVDAVVGIGLVWRLW